MKGYRFYLEFESPADKRKGNHSGNVVAIPVDSRGSLDRDMCFWSDKRFMVECIAGVFDYADSPVCGTAISTTILRDNHKRISESRAREIHPKLFKYLEDRHA